MNSTQYKQISPQELNTWMEKDTVFTLIDTLPGVHFRNVHIPQATNACVFEVNFIEQVKAINADKNARIVLYGASSRSKDAITAAEKLEREGYRQIHLLTGGIEAWRSAALRVEGEALDQPDDPQTVLALKDRSYRVDTKQSTIRWIGRNPNTTHFGNIDFASGTFTVKDKIITGRFDIDMNSITNKSLEGDESQPVLIEHLKSDDFFLTTLFPTATFNILSAAPIEEPFLTVPNYLVNGTLELRGIKVRQDLMATVSRTAENGLAAEAHFDLDRTKWNIIYGSSRFFEYLGMHLIFDLISIQMRIVAS